MKTTRAIRWQLHLEADLPSSTVIKQQYELLFEYVYVPLIKIRDPRHSRVHCASLSRR